MANANTIELTMNIPKPIVYFLKTQIKSGGYKKNTLEKAIVTALIDAIDAQLNSLDVSTRRNLIVNSDLNQILDP